MRKVKDSPIVMGVVIGPVQRSVTAQDWVWVAGWIAGRFGCEVEASWVTREINQYPVRRETRYSDGSWAMFWKNRLAQHHKLPIAPRPDPEDDPICAVLHIAFVGIYEDDLMVARLPERGVDIGSKKRRASTPGIERVMTAPQPIDRVAARVVGTPTTTEGE